MKAQRFHQGRLLNIWNFLNVNTVWKQGYFRHLYYSAHRLKLKFVQWFFSHFWTSCFLSFVRRTRKNFGSFTCARWKCWVSPSSFFFQEPYSQVILDNCRLSCNSRCWKCNRYSTVELLVFYGLVQHRPISGGLDVHHRDLAFQQPVSLHGT